MAMTEDKAADAPVALPISDQSRPEARRPLRDLQRTFRLVLATIWLLDAALQLQPFMFTPGSSGFSGMLTGFAAGNPSWFHHIVVWNASIIDHHPVWTNAAFASIQFLIALGIIYKRSCKPALALSIVWAMGVWWFGESAGEIFQGGATPFGGGPGGVLFYAVLAVLLWPSEGTDEPFVAARTVGVRAAKAIWAVLWGLLALLSVVGSGRSPQALHDLVVGVNVGEPGWLARIDNSAAALFLHHGTTLAIVLAIVCVIVAIGVFLPPPVAQATIVLAVVVFALIWIAVQNFGGILAGGATDPNSGLLVILLALIYWPLTNSGTRSNQIVRADLSPAAKEA
ncbi:MAG: hypothetical protein ACLPYW_08525 [Acidimicrobiales bacterium]